MPAGICPTTPTRREPATGKEKPCRPPHQMLPCCLDTIDASLWRWSARVPRARPESTGGSPLESHRNHDLQSPASPTPDPASEKERLAKWKHRPATPASAARSRPPPRVRRA